ncbi:protein S100-A10-like [Protopterus annectens]|uniref:protein S100-A10-like n=1 Tax=Protopterus annectens TaxID=7888 RepID=UPI001CFA426D|nr:protein S100-A10-like [Protopterus annectens]XP_043935886.1 protein S100-A10-like [Protopterus annectens]
MDQKTADNAKAEQKSENKPSPMEECIQTLFMTFVKYAGGKNHLTYAEYEKLMNTEVPEFVQKQCPGTLKRLLKDVDNKNEDMIYFSEYFAIVAGLLNGCFQMHHIMKPRH